MEVVLLWSQAGQETVPNEPTRSCTCDKHPHVKQYSLALVAMHKLIHVVCADPALNSGQQVMHVLLWLAMYFCQSSPWHLTDNIVFMSHQCTCACDSPKFVCAMKATMQHAIVHDDSHLHQHVCAVVVYQQQKCLPASKGLKQGRVLPEAILGTLRPSSSCCPSRQLI